MLCSQSIFTSFIQNYAKKEKVFIYSQYGKFSYHDAYIRIKYTTDWILRNNFFSGKRESSQVFLVEGDGEVSHIVFLLAALELNIPFIPLNKAISRSGHLSKDLSHTVRVKCRGLDILVAEKKMTIGDSETEILFHEETGMIEGEQVRSIEKLACCFPTSGTTGLPKMIAVSNIQLKKGADFVIDALQINSKDVLMGILSLDFDYGLNQVFCAIVAGASYICFQISTITKEALISLPRLLF